MRLRRVKSVLPAQDGEAKIAAMCWSPNSRKLAVCTADRSVVLFDDNGERRDKFSTKPSDPSLSKKTYVVKAIEFSPDSTKLAVGQSDDIVYVYRIGEDWGEKKVICNKFPLRSTVTCLSWPSEGPLVIGLSDGKVRAAYLKNNKSSSLYSSDSYVVSLTSNVSGRGILSGHANGAVIRFFFDDEGSSDVQGKVCTHTCAPFALAWASHAIIAAGCDKVVTVYSPTGAVQKRFDYTRNGNDIDFTVAVCSPSGHSVLVGSFNRLRVYFHNIETSEWEEGKPKEVANWYSISTLAWSKDGSKVAVGTLCGVCDLFDCSLKKYVYKNKFEIVYVDASQVIIRHVNKQMQGVLKSKFGHKIIDIKIHGRDRYVIGRTAQTLLLSDLEQKLMSEIPWSAIGGKEKFYFGYEQVCVIFNAGEMSIIEYGHNGIIGCVRTELTNPHLISVRFAEHDQVANKTLAYLVDLKTIAIVDLVNEQLLSQISHESKIDWLELNEMGTRLLYRDRRQRLNLIDVASGDRKAMLNYCSFVQWVPNSDVIVAQNRSSLCVWYNINSPDKITVVPIKGEIQEIQRYDNKTDVIVREGMSTVTYGLDEGLIEFGTAVDSKDFKRAAVYLERIGFSEETKDMWLNLGKLAVEAQILPLAEYCYASVGDVSKAQYLRETLSLAEEAASTTVARGFDFYRVKARLAILLKDFKLAEQIYLEQDKVDEAISMYQDFHKWDDAIELARTKGHQNLHQLREDYLSWLLETQQEEKAGEVKEKEGEFEEAIELYLSAGLPSRAGRVVTTMPKLAENDQLVQKIASSLMKGEFYEHAGDLYEKISDYRKALECYRLGNAFARAVELARAAFPEEVVLLEEEWADHLMSVKQLEAAIHHYIEAGKTLKALDAAVNGKLWKKAVDIMEIIDDPVAISKYFKIMAQHYYSIGAYDLAEHLLVEGGMAREAIDMYNRIREWDKAYKLAAQYLDPEEVSDMYVTQGKKLEEDGNCKDAEKLYISAQEPELAIEMYKNLKQYDHVIRLVKHHFPETLDKTYKLLAGKLESEGNYIQAEQFHLSVEDWKAAINMYRNVDMWEEAFRVAKTKGTPTSEKQVAYLWAKTLTGESAVKLLNRLGALESAIDYATENCAFDFAFELVRYSSVKNKEEDVHLKYAMFLEDEGKFNDAEQEFIMAKKPKEAVLMYVHNHNWESAQRVAEEHDKDSVTDVLIGQAGFAFEKQDYQRMESLLLRAEKVDLLVKYYKDAGMWSDALRVCKEYTPSKLTLLQDEYDLGSSGCDSKDIEQLYQQGHMWEEGGQYHKAVKYYMQVDSKKSEHFDYLEKCWNRAADLALKFFSTQQAEDLIRQVAPKLQSIQKHVSAAQMYLKVDNVKAAIDALIEADEWTKAKRIAVELNPQFVDYVDNRYKEVLKSQGKTDQLASLDVGAALDLLAEQKQWRKCLDMAEKQGSSVLHKYVALFVAELIDEGKIKETLKLYVKYGTPAYPNLFPTYKGIAYTVLGLKDLFSFDAYYTWANLRDVLFDLCQNFKHVDGREQQEFSTLLTISHYYAIRSACINQSSLEKQCAKISVSLLRYIGSIRVDKAFYEAGLSAKTAGWLNMAFVFWNQYLDICEAMEENNPEALDLTLFKDTDIPTKFNLPSDMYLSETEHEEVKEWVLSISMDGNVEQVLPQDERSTYEASLSSPTGREYQSCVVTGYPVLRNKLELGNKIANKDDWNKYLMAAKVSDSSECQDVLRFISLWCGGTSTLSYSFQ